MTVRVSMHVSGHVPPESRVSSHVYERINQHVQPLRVHLDQREPGRDACGGGLQDDQQEDRQVGSQEDPADQRDGEEGACVRDK